ncbi:MAG TPA: hypothetical protein VEC13_01465 [Candidatus Paceibacterota bacterium]|nr:hypothetical protein [Candidatus Paceibacterota bacterium]
MTRKVIILLSAVVVLFLLVLGFLFFIARKAPEPTDSAFTQKVRELFPFGRPAQDPDDLFTGEGTEFPETGLNGEVSLGDRPVPRLRKISSEPTAGTYHWSEVKPDTKEIIYHVEYADRATGRIYDAESNKLPVTQISNTTLPKMYEAKFASTDSFLSRFLDNNREEVIKTYFVTLRLPTQSATTSTSTPLLKVSTGTYLEENIKEIAFSPSKSKVAYSIYTPTGGSIIVSNPNGSNKRQVFASPLREWLLEWISETGVLITTKPSGLAEGYAYNLNTSSGGLTKITGGLGLTMSVSPKTAGFYLVGKGGGTISTTFLKTDAAKGNQTLYLSRTLPEKCVWSKKDSNIIYCAVPSSVPSSLYPDDWYQGIVSFTDSIWKINVETAQTNIVVTPSDSGAGVDAINLEVSENDEFLTFINKKDLSLWGYQLVVPIKKEVSVQATSTPATTTPAR